MSSNTLAFHVSFLAPLLLFPIVTDVCELTPVFLLDHVVQGLYLAPFGISHVSVTHSFSCPFIHYIVSEIGDIIMITVFCKHFWNLKNLDDFHFTCGSECC